MNKTLLENTLLLFDRITDVSVNEALRELSAVMLRKNNPSGKARIILSTPGGESDPGFAFFDTIKLLGGAPSIVATGEVGSIGVLLLLSVPLERRFITENGMLFLHEFNTRRKKGEIVRVGSRKFKKLPSETREGLKVYQDKYVTIVSNETSLTRKKVLSLMEEETYLSAEKAVEYGFARKL